MTEMKLTAGPWIATERSGYQEILAHDAECDWYGHKNMHAVAYVDTEVDEDEQAEIARLIASAPELLEALEALFDNYKQLADSGDAGNWYLEDQPVGKKAMAAIAKARGEA